MSRQRPCATGTRARSTPAVPLHSGVPWQPGIGHPGLPTSSRKAFLHILAYQTWIGNFFGKNGPPATFWLVGTHFSVKTDLRRLFWLVGTQFFVKRTSGDDFCLGETSGGVF